MAKAKNDGKRPDWNGKLYYNWNPSPDSMHRTGRHPAVINMIENTEGYGITLWESGTLEELPSMAYAIILLDGPIYDVMTAGTDIIVSEAVQKFLGQRLGDCCHFLPVALLDKKSNPAGKQYYGIRILRSMPAFLSFIKYDLKQISTCGFPLLVAYNKSDDCMRSYFIEAELAEEMIAAGFTGLGFTNIFDDRKPGQLPIQQFAEVQKLPKTAPEKRLDKIREIALAAGTTGDRWANLLLLLKRANRSKKWLELSDANVDADAKAAAKWIKALITKTPPNDNVLAFWFGLFEAWENDMSVPKIYVRGSSTYNKDAPYDIEWAGDSSWGGSDCKYDSIVMRQLGEFAEKHEALADTVMYTAVLGYAAILVRVVLDGLSKKSSSAFGQRKCPVAIGFDSGDFLFLGEW